MYMQGCLIKTCIHYSAVGLPILSFFSLQPATTASLPVVVVVVAPLAQDTDVQQS